MELNYDILTQVSFRV